MSQLDAFKERLKSLKEQGVDIDPEAIVQDVIESQIPINEPEYVDSKLLRVYETDEKKPEIEGVVAEKIKKLVFDYVDFYAKKGRKLKVSVEIIKENAADTYTEEFLYSDDLVVEHIVGIGTKGKYSPVDIKNGM